MMTTMIATCVLLGSQPTLLIEGTVPGDADFVMLPFEVPAQTVEVEIRHDNLASDNTLDFGLYDPHGYRGWGGGNSEPIIVSADAASRSYLPGEITAGIWQIVVGLADTPVLPAPYRIEVLLRDTLTLAPQPGRAPYVAAILSDEARWYAGDFHVHSQHSGDASASLDEIAGFARGRGLDFVHLSDHNTHAQTEFIVGAQGRNPELLFIPGVELTTYGGHLNGVGAVGHVDHRLGIDGRAIDDVIDDLQAQRALVSINHPVLELGSLCIGCAWQHGHADQADAIEIATGGWQEAGWLFTIDAIEFWEQALQSGAHIAALGGSDDHRAGVGLPMFGSPIGSPTTMVFAEGLSADAIIAGVRAGRTVIKLQGPDDPMIDLRAHPPRGGDTVIAMSATLSFVATGAAGLEARLVRDGEIAASFPITADSATFEHEVEAPASGEARWRVEIWDGDTPRTVTSHLWIRRPGAIDPSSGGCAATGRSAAGTILATMLLVALCRRRRSRSVP